MLWVLKIFLEQNFIQNQGLEYNSSKRQGVGVNFWDFPSNVDLCSYEKWCGLGAGTIDCDWHSIYSGPVMARTHQSLSARWL
jgi:hypothetical protein